MRLSLPPRPTLAAAMLLTGLVGASGGTLAGSPQFVQFDPSKFIPRSPVWEQPEAEADDDTTTKKESDSLRGTFRATGALSPADSAGGEGEGEGEGEAGASAGTDGAKPPERKLPDFSGATGKTVIVIPIDGTIDLGLAPFVARVVEEAGESDAAAVVLDVNTFGGRVDAAVRIKDALLGSKVPTIAFVNRRAISAGALISLACDVIGVTSGATLGAATPVQMGGGGGGMQPVAEKVVSYMRKEMRSTAEAKNRSGDLAEGMVDADHEVEGLAPKGKLLTLTTKEGLAAGMFDLEAETLEELLKSLGLGDNPVRRAGVNWAEKVARILTDPTVSGMLMTFGFLGLMMELYTAGFGVTGLIGICCLLLFFLGHVVADLAGFEELLLFFLGIALLVGEGLGLSGGTGLLAVVGVSMVVSSLVMALVEAPFEVSWETGDIASALTRVAIALGVTLLGAVVMSRLFPKTALFRRIVLETSLEGVTAGVPDLEDYPGVDVDLIGAEGVTVTYLRPFGKAKLKGRRIEVTTEGGFLEAGVAVRVVRIEGRNVVVRRLDDEDDRDAAEADPSPAEG